MEFFTGAGVGRCILVGLKKGDLILESIQEVIEKTGIRNAVVLSGIGASRKMRCHRIGDLKDDPSDEIFTVEQPIEIGGFSGLIIDGIPHLHVTFADHERAYAAHMENGCEIQYVGEIAILELLEDNLCRRADEHGVRLLSPRG